MARKPATNLDFSRRMAGGSAYSVAVVVFFRFFFDKSDKHLYHKS